MAEFTIGTRVKDRYVLRQFIGSGSFGEVWLAEDDILNSEVAIKIYISLDSRGVEEFKTEYRITQGVYHPNLLTPSYFDIWEHRPFLVMKYCSQGAITNYIDKVDEQKLWQFIHDVAAGLHYLHSLPEPIIHQDIKPDNILVDDSGHFLITDFGISKKIRATMRKQSTRAVTAGATAYMAPERFTADPMPIKASDIWSLGASIYELCCGELPFSGLGGGMQNSGAAMPSLDNRWSPEMNLVMQSCLAKEPWDRPTAAQLELYASQMLAGEVAVITWHQPDIDDDDEEDSDVSSGKLKGLWMFLVFIVVAVATYAIYSCRGHHAEAIEEEIEIVEDSIECVPIAVEEEEAPEPAPELDIERQEINSTPVTKVSPFAKSQAPTQAERFSKAKANNDYTALQQLANEGYAPAYGPLASHYLAIDRYDAANTYAQKAKAAGYAEGDWVIEALDKLGYYDSTN